MRQTSGVKYFWSDWILATWTQEWGGAENPHQKVKCDVVKHDGNDYFMRSGARLQKPYSSTPN